MARTFLIGVAAAVIGGIGLMIGGALGMDLNNTILGAGGGLIIAVVRVGAPLERLIGYLIGLVLGVGFAALRLGVFPGGESAWGGAIALGLVLLVVAVVSGLTANRIQAWTLLLGMLVYVASVTSLMETKPWTAAEQLPGEFLSILAMSAIGFLVIIAVELFPEKSGRPADGGGQGDDVAPREPAAQITSVDGIIGGAK
ncbi:MAG: hypothetical protein U0904_09075 [Candidatus Nanopelagicales bacterium]|nr:hypothetical protein [Candidatus Nanopelagicales bacterium]